MENNKEKIIFPKNCSSSLLYDLRDVTYNLENIEKIYGVEIKTINDIKTYIHDLQIKREENVKNVLNNLKNYYGKFIHLRAIDSSSNHVVEEYVMMPYRYVKANDCLFGIICNLHNEYKGGLNDDSINLLKLLDKYNIEISEIDEEEFILASKRKMFECLTQRWEKINSDNYAIGDNGYYNTEDIELPF